MAASTEVYKDLVLHISPDKLYIEPLDHQQEIVIIDRLSYEVTVQANQGQVPTDVTSKAICGIVGIINLLAGPYLVVITRKSKVGEINGESIWRVESTELIQYTKTLLHLSETQIQDNRIYVSMMQQVLGTEHFYFSYSYDVSHTLQRLHNTTPDFLSMPLHERADPRFVWNGHLLRELAQQFELSRYLLPLIHGFVSIRSCTINHKTFSWILISRRSCFRAGTRFFMRGIDSEGHAANFVETEQIVEYHNDRCSFVQTRGSIPLFWSQRPNLRYKPVPLLNPIQNHVEGFLRHFHNLVYNYGHQCIVNLIDHKGAEHHLEKALAEVVHSTNNDQIRYESFDFHHECRKMRYDRLSVLIERLSSDQDKLGFFLRLRDGSVPGQQNGVFRTNCIDSLDRTNVVQSLLARRSLERQLHRLGILQEGQRIEEQVDFEFVYKNIWADNADICSIQYAGTGALKTDYTRTGHRTKAGLLKDGFNSLVRYYKNNFSDGFRQDAIDLFLGNYQVENIQGVTRPSPFQQDQDWKYLAMPVILLVALSMCFVTIIIPAEYTLETLLYFLFWIAMSALTFLIIMYYGIEFVDKPKLCESNRKKNE